MNQLQRRVNIDPSTFAHPAQPMGRAAAGPGASVSLSLVGANSTSPSAFSACAVMPGRSRGDLGLVKGSCASRVEVCKGAHLPGGGLMRWSVGTLLMIVALGGPAHATSEADWVALTIRVGPGGSDQPFNVRLQLDGIEGGDEPSVSGVGDGLPQGWDLWIPFVNGATIVRTSRDLGNVKVVFEPGEAEHDGRTSLDYEFGALPGGYVRTILLFRTGKPATPSWQVTPTQDSVQTTVAYGTGSSVMELADADGTTATFGAAGLSTVDASLHTEQGIVGEFVLTCETCSGSWEAPDGRRGKWGPDDSLGAGPLTIVPPLVPLPTSAPDFWGDRGTWHFSWSGISSSGAPNAVFLAWIPIGPLAIPPLAAVPGNSYCSSDLAVEPAECDFTFLGSTIEVGAAISPNILGISPALLPPSFLPSAYVSIRVLGPNQEVLVACRSLDGESSCHEIVPAPPGLPIGSRLRCEAEGFPAYLYSCSS